MESHAALLRTYIYIYTLCIHTYTRIKGPRWPYVYGGERMRERERKRERVAIGRKNNILDSRSTDERTNERTKLRYERTLKTLREERFRSPRFGSEILVV